MKVKVVSVVRDFEMYSRCLKDNANCSGCEFVCFDNREVNRPIPECYNSVLESQHSGDPGEGDCWFVFCHEDWMPLRRLDKALTKLDRNGVYGIAGAFSRKGPVTGRCYQGLNGWLLMARKDGGDRNILTGFRKAGRVSTLDCQCVIVHGSLLEKYGLRFDPAFPFDMYAEDFCAAAYLKAGIQSRTIALPSVHYSYGTVGERFNTALADIRKKYSGSPVLFVSIVGSQSCFGKGAGTLTIHRLHRPLLLKLYQYLNKRVYFQQQS